MTKSDHFVQYKTLDCYKIFLFQINAILLNCIYDHINASLVSIRDIFQKHIKNLTDHKLSYSGV